MIIKTNNWYLHQIDQNRKILKNKTLYILFFLYNITSSAQVFQLKVSGNTNKETQTIDSVGYISNHQNTKNTIEEINKLSDKLSKKGYIENQIIEIHKTSDSIYTTKIALGNKTKNIHIYIGKNNPLNIHSVFEEKKDTLIISYPEVENFFKQTIEKLEQEGYSFAKLKLINIKNKDETLFADLEIKYGTKRLLNEIIIKYENEFQNNLFPKGALKQINKKYIKKTFNQTTTNEIYNEFQKFSFINQLKYPEILFTKDTTKIYVYLSKRKTNTFDGFLGFNTSENKKTTLNGYLDFTLQNALRTGEELSIFWKNDGYEQKTFNAKIDLPYISNSSFGIKALINIFKQDSTYQNTKLEINLGYLISIDKRIYFGYQSTESSNVQNTDKVDLKDYTNSYITTNYEYKISNYNNELDPIKTYLYFSISSGKRKTNLINNTTKNEKQNLIHFNIMNNFYFNEKNCINIKSLNYFLKSKTYLTNELFRFGGINSIRGFSENSLQANFMTSIITEYKYLISPNLQLNTFLDYCYYQDPTAITKTKRNTNLIGLGFGFNVNTKNGLIKLAIANGSNRSQEIKFYNTFISISYNVKF